MTRDPEKIKQLIGERDAVSRLPTKRIELRCAARDISPTDT